MDIVGAVRKLFYLLSTLIYQLITNMYEIFLRISNSRILDSEILESISSRIGLLLGIIMLFMVIVSGIQMILEPDRLTDKEKGMGNIAKKILIVIVMLGMSSTAFRAMYGIQKLLIDSDIISKFLLPYEINSEKFGGILSSELFRAFYYFDKDVASENHECNEKAGKLKVDIKNKNDFSIGEDCVSTKENDVYVMNFNWLLAPIVGLVVVYFLFSYCLSVGIRSVQLAFLEIISPMAIISYLSPKKDTMFSKWWKLYFSTYIDVFLRIMIINLVVFLIETILETEGVWAFWNTVEKAGDWTDTLIQVLMIIALLTFAKKAPDLLKELFPGSSSKLGLGVKSPKKMFSDMLGGNLVEGAAKMATGGLAIGAVGAVTSSVSRFRANWKNGNGFGRSMLGAAGGLVGGFGRGVIAGGKKGNVFGNMSKGIKEQRKINDEYDELITSGGSLFGKQLAGLTSYFGETKGQTYNRTINNIDKMNDFKKSMTDAADEISFVKSAKDAWQQMTQWKNERREDYMKRKQEAYDQYKFLRDKAIDASVKYEETKDINDCVIFDQHGNPMVDYSGNVISLANNNDDMMYGRGVVSVVKNADAYSKSHSVEYWDNSSNEFKKLGPITNRQDLSNASTSAYDTKTHITSQPDYNSAIAEDKAAGVNSNGSGKK